MRLGLNYILPEYLLSIKRVFSIPQNVGIAGGRENSALYFVGISEPSNNLLYLDPHLVQKSVPSEHIVNNATLWQYAESYHCTKIKRMPLDKMCTSVALGFYIRNHEEYLEFKRAVKDLANVENSIISVYDKKP